MASCFSPAHNTTSRHQHHHPSASSSSSSSSTAERISGFLAVLIASLTHLAAKLKPHHGGSPRKFMSNVSHKAMKMVHRRNNNRDHEDAENNMGGQPDHNEALWQRAILMGDKCQPLEFSGVIYYDENGKQQSERPPRSPRSPLPSYPQARS